MIDMHAHWRPAEVADALRARTREPRILRNQDGVEVLKSPRMGEAPLAKAFDDVDFHLARMDRQGVETSVLSLLGSFCWIESQPLEESGPLCRTVNDGLSAICQEASRPLRRLRGTAADRHFRRRRRARAGARAAGHDRRADPGQLLPDAQGRRSDASAAGSREPPPRGALHPSRPAAGRRFPQGRERHGQCAPPQRHARHAGEPVLGDGDVVPHRLSSRTTPTR